MRKKIIFNFSISSLIKKFSRSLPACSHFCSINANTINNRKLKKQLDIIIITAHMDFGKFRDALDYGHHQLGISEELDNPQMRSEAYLNLARAHEKLGRWR